MRKFEPDCIIALGGGSSMDAAKVMWLMYENPEVNFDDIKQNSWISENVLSNSLELGKKAKLILYSNYIRNWIRSYSFRSYH